METEKSVAVLSMQAATKTSGEDTVKAEQAVESPEENNQEEEKIVVEIVNTQREHVKQRRHERTMNRTIRWPISSNSHRITF